MLSYLAAALPADASAAARLLALQCALRANRSLHVRLPKGLLRSVRLDTADPWRELEHARWLRTMSQTTAHGVSAELLDVTLLEQSPARPDRMHAAHWALRVSSEAAEHGPLLQLASLYLAAHTEPEDGSGHSEADHMAHTCGTSPAELTGLFLCLTAAGLLRSWDCLESGDVHWAWHGGGKLRKLMLRKAPM
jgi:hypothetical protein